MALCVCGHVDSWYTGGVLCVCEHAVAITVPMLVVAGGDEWRFAANIKLCSNVTVWWEFYHWTVHTSRQQYICKHPSSGAPHAAGRQCIVSSSSTARVAGGRGITRHTGTSIHSFVVTGVTCHSKNLVYTREGGKWGPARTAVQLSHCCRTEFWLMDNSNKPPVSHTAHKKDASSQILTYWHSFV